MDESNLVAHARRELNILGYDQESLDKFLNVVQAFADMGNSGGSAAFAIPTLCDLFQFKNLSPLTNDPSEWLHVGEEVWGEPGGIWQNIRNGGAFSRDSGASYYLLDEPKDIYGNKIIHVSVDYQGEAPVESDSPSDPEGPYRPEDVYRIEANS